MFMCLLLRVFMVLSLILVDGMKNAGPWSDISS